MTSGQILAITSALDHPRKTWYPPRPRSIRRSRISTHRRMTQQKHSTRDLQELLTAAPCGLVLLDRHAVIEFMNPMSESLLGLNPNEAVGQQIVAAVPAWKDTSLVASLPSLLDAQSTFEAMEFDLPGPNKRVLRVSAAHVPNGTEKASGVVLSFFECTELASLERKLHRAEYQASIGKLARGIAHELNSPLDGVLRYSHLALEHLRDDSPVREYVLHIKEGLDRMVRAVKAFLEFSRQVSTPVNRVADLNKLIEDVLLLVQHRAKFQQVQIVKRFDPSLPTVLDGGIQHAVLNLVKNSFDAMPRGGTLTITTHHTDSQVDVEVEDTGMGIPEELRVRIFEPFFSTKPIHQGSGLGLIIAKEVVERSGGTIEFVSQPGAGTTFRIHIPIAPAEAEQNGT